MSVDVTFPVEFNERVMQYLMTKHAELGEIEEDHLVSKFYLFCFSKNQANYFFVCEICILV